VVVELCPAAAGPFVSLEEQKMPTIIQLSGERRGTLRRSIPGTDDMLVFVPREPVAVDDSLLDVIRKDLGTALVVCIADHNGIYRSDAEATADVKAGKSAPKPKKTPSKKKTEKLVPQDTAEKMTPDVLE